MVFYRTSFPDASIIPKMHLLEDHMCSWLQLYNLGAGLMGEQGAESIHQHINRLENVYSGIVNPVERLKYIFNMYTIETTPSLLSLKPHIKSRKRKKRPLET